MHQYPKFIFVIKPYMFRASSVPIIRDYPLHTRQFVRFMQVMWLLPSRIRLELFQSDSARKRSRNLQEAYQLPCVQWITPNDGHRRCPKHVVFYDKNKFWILMHLVGYFYEMVLHIARATNILSCKPKHSEKNLNQSHFVSWRNRSFWSDKPASVCLLWHAP